MDISKLKSFIQQLLFIALLLQGTLSLTPETLSAQVYSDEEISFDREKVGEMFLSDGVKEADLHKKMTLYRESLTAAHYLELQDPLPDPVTSTGCGNIDFSDGFNNEWCYKRVERPSAQCNSQTCECNSDGEPNFNGTNCMNFGSGIGGSMVFDIPYDNNPDMYNGDIGNLNLDEFGSSMIRIGNRVAGAWVERIEKNITVTEGNRLLSYRYAVALQDPGHCKEEQPYFRMYILNQNGVKIDCSVFEATAGFEGINCTGSICYKPASVNTIDLFDFVSVGDEITLVVEVADCTLTGHYGYAFFEGLCSEIDSAITANTYGEGFCTEVDITFSATQDYYGEDLPQWRIFNGSSVEASGTTASITHNFSQPGDYTIEVTIPLAGNDDPNCNTITYTRDITIEECPCICEDCDSFTPVPGEYYVVSGWVLEEHDTPPLSYEDTYIRLGFERGPFSFSNSIKFRPSGEIIDGWQRIAGEFRVPSNTDRIAINLVNSGENGVEAYFDDIRIHPFNSNLKSFVYDQQTQQLMAELDENNYATFYEYDKEGGLIRIKKETERGIYTIQETRSGNSELSNIQD